MSYFVTIFVTHLSATVHVSHGPWGWVEWVQPRRLSAGLGWVRGHAVFWRQAA